MEFLVKFFELNCIKPSENIINWNWKWFEIWNNGVIEAFLTSKFKCLFRHFNSILPYLKSFKWNIQFTLLLWNIHSNVLYFGFHFIIEIHCEKETGRKISRGKIKEELIDVYLTKLSQNADGIPFSLQILSYP